MWTNLLARTFAWMVLLQQTGPINRMLMALGVIHEPLVLVNNLTGVTIGMTYIMLPFVVMPLHATLRSIDPSTLRAAAICGASRWQAFWRVLVPLAMPGIASGALMVFVMALGYFVTPALLGGPSYMMLAELIAQLVQQLLNWGLAGAAAFVLLVVTLALYAVQLRFSRPRADRIRRPLRCCSISIVWGRCAGFCWASVCWFRCFCCCRLCSSSRCRSAIRNG
jgi:putative spermidine/putrescine transport system permease protein